MICVFNLESISHLELFFSLKNVFDFSWNLVKYNQLNNIEFGIMYSAVPNFVLQNFVYFLNKSAGITC